ncbi:MAG: rhodanese-like domain-containing protein, partial [Saprospiraceae bacterium]
MKYLKLLPLFAFAFLFGTISAQAQESASLEQVGPIKATLMVRNGALMVDVREKDEVAELAYDVENIINIPLSELESRLSEIPKDKQLVMACRSGNRSRQAANILIKNGYTNLVNLEGGMLAWQEKNLAVIQGGKSTKKAACCADPKSKNCNPDGTCKTPAKGS